MEINCPRKAFIVRKLLNLRDKRVICKEIEWFAMGNDNKTTITFWHRTEHKAKNNTFSDTGMHIQTIYILSNQCIREKIAKSSSRLPEFIIKKLSKHFRIITLYKASLECTFRQSIFCQTSTYVDMRVSICIYKYVGT